MLLSQSSLCSTPNFIEPVVIPLCAQTHNLRIINHWLLKFSADWLLFMFFCDWIQLSGATQCSKRRSQFGRLAYWQMGSHPSRNQYVLFWCPGMFTHKSERRAPQWFQTIRPSFPSTSLHFNSFGPVRNDFGRPSRSLQQKCNRICLPTLLKKKKNAAAKSSNETRHPSPSCSVEEVTLMQSSHSISDTLGLNYGEI